MTAICDGTCTTLRAARVARSAACAVRSRPFYLMLLHHLTCSRLVEVLPSLGVVVCRPSTGRYLVEDG